MGVEQSIFSRTLSITVYNTSSSSVAIKTIDSTIVHCNASFDLEPRHNVVVFLAATTTFTLNDRHLPIAQNNAVHVPHEIEDLIIHLGNGKLLIADKY